MYIGLKIAFIYSIFPKHESYHQNTYLVHLIKFLSSWNSYDIQSVPSKRECVFLLFEKYMK